MENSNPPEYFVLTLLTKSASEVSELLPDYVQAVWWNDEHTLEGMIDPPFKEAFFDYIKELAIGYEELSFSSQIPYQEYIPPFPIVITPFLIGTEEFMTSVPKPLVPLVLESKEAFGLGEHETTETCLEEIASLSELPLQKALDIGCGSGILSLAIAKLSHATVIACDIDPQAVAVTKRHAKLNHVAKLFVYESDGIQHPKILSDMPYDLIVANIPSILSCRMAEEIESLLNTEGYLIVSGLLVSQREEVLRAFLTHSLTLHKEIHRGQWCTLVFCK